MWSERLRLGRVMFKMLGSFIRWVKCFWLGEFYFRFLKEIIKWSGWISLKFVLRKFGEKEKY